MMMFWRELKVVLGWKRVGRGWGKGGEREKRGKNRKEEIEEIEENEEESLHWMCR